MVDAIDRELRDLQHQYTMTMARDLVDHGFESEDALLLPAMPWLVERLAAKLEASAARYDPAAPDADEHVQAHVGRALHYLAMVRRLKALVDRMRPAIEGSLFEQALRQHWRAVQVIQAALPAEGRA
jgi:hypothetical protein